MKLFVAFKICPDLDLLREEDIVITEEMGMDTHFLPNIINCYDESALELVLRARDNAKNQLIELTAFTLGNEHSEITLKSLRALGYQNTIRAVDEHNETRFQAETVAETIACYIKKHHQDCILIGKEAPVENQGVMAQLVARKTEYPLIGTVIDILEIEESYVTVLVQNAGEIVKEKIACPCVLCIGNAVISKLRVPTLRQRMQSAKIQTAYIDIVKAKKVHMKMPNEVVKNSTKRMCYQVVEKGEKAIIEVQKHSLQKALDQI